MSIDTFWDRVQVTGACWLWAGACSSGYGRVQVDGVSRRTHRHAYELLVGPIPSGMVLDHLCAITNCINPDHLEVVTSAENAARAKFSQRHSTRWLTREGLASATPTIRVHVPGTWNRPLCLRKLHAMEPGNVYIPPSGERRCRACRRDRKAEGRQRARRQETTPDPRLKD